MHQELQDLLDRFDNVRLTPWRLATIWGGASLQQMLIRAMEDADTMTDWNWDFFVNLSESDFPFRCGRGEQMHAASGKNQLLTSAKMGTV